ncbi:MAG: Rv3235 family protein [Candidatus Nanopelagicales bacterium]
MTTATGTKPRPSGPAPGIRLRVVPAPDCNPAPTVLAPEPVPSRSAAGARWQQDALDLVYALPSGLPAIPEAPPRLRIVAGVTAVAGRADVSAWASRFVPALVEVLSGDRPVSQLMRWTDREVYEEIRKRVENVPRSSGRRQARAAVRSIHLCQPRPGAAEITAVVRAGRRTRALAVRLDVIEDRWRCTEFAVV